MSKLPKKKLAAMFVVSIKQHPIKKTNEFVDIQKAGLNQTHFFPCYYAIIEQFID